MIKRTIVLIVFLIFSINYSYAIDGLTFSTFLDRKHPNDAYAITIPDSSNEPARYGVGDKLFWNYTINNRETNFRTTVCFYLKDLKNDKIYDITRIPILREANKKHHTCDICESKSEEICKKDTENPCPIKLENFEIGITNGAVKGNIFTYTFPESFPEGTYELITQLREPNVVCSNPDGIIPSTVPIKEGVNHIIIHGEQNLELLRIIPLNYIHGTNIERFDRSKLHTTISGKFVLKNVGSSAAQISNFVVKPDLPNQFTIGISQRPYLNIWEAETNEFIGSGGYIINNDKAVFNFERILRIMPGKSVLIDFSISISTNDIPEEQLNIFIEQTIGKVSTITIQETNSNSRKFNNIQPIIVGYNPIIPLDQGNGFNNNQLDRKLILNLVNSGVPASSIIDWTINLWSGDFSRVLRAAINTNLPLSEVIKAFRALGYLRQIVQATLSAGIEPEIIVRTLKDSDVSLEELIQLQDYFQVSNDVFHNILIRSGFSQASVNRVFNHVEVKGFHISKNFYARFSNNPNIDKQYNRLLLKAIYLVPRGRPLQSNWGEGIDIIMQETVAFYKRELRQKVIVNYKIFPIIVNGDHSIDGQDRYNTQNNCPEGISCTTVDYEIISRIFKSNGDLYNKDFSQRRQDEYDVLVTFMEARNDGGLGWYFESNNNLQRDDIPENSIFGGSLIPVPHGFFDLVIETKMANRNLPSIFGFTLHEVGHSIGLPHSWEVIENPSDIRINRNFHNVVGNVMSYSWIPGKVNYFIPDSLINLLLGRPKLNQQYVNLDLHKDPPSLERGDTTTLRDDIINYINIYSSENVPDGLILRSLLGSNIQPGDIIDAFQRIEGDFGRLITAARSVGIEKEKIVIALRRYGLTSTQLKNPFILNPLDLNENDMERILIANNIE